MVTPSATTADGVTQMLHYTTHNAKGDLLLSMLREERETVLVFTRTKHRADQVGRVLGRAGHKVAILHGDRSLPQRRAALEGFKRGTFRVLVATDIAARGIDVANIGHVINYDLPMCPEDYIHRIGRTARMKTTGRATSFVTAEDPQQLKAIEHLLGQAVPLAPGSARPASDLRASRSQGSQRAPHGSTPRLRDRRHAGQIPLQGSLPAN
jgi:ATP-dependent RNA helicase RhlE